jgi:hypothetical protein
MSMSQSPVKKVSDGGKDLISDLAPPPLTTSEEADQISRGRPRQKRDSIQG